MVAPSENSASGDPTKRPKKGEPRGRPTDYDPDKCPPTAIRLYQLGSTDADIAEAFDVSVATIYEWRKRHPEFDDAVKTGRRLADDAVEKALWQRAVGYSHPDMHASSYMGDVTLTPIVKIYPPSETAATFWLKNRRPREWRERVELGIDVDASAKLTADEQARLWAANYRASAAISERLVASIEMKNVTGSAGGTIAPA